MNPDPHAVLRGLPPVLLGLAAAFLFDHMCVLRRLQPPGFRVAWRRLLAGLVLACLLAVGIFAPVSLLSVGEKPAPDFSKITTPQLFGFHVLMLATMGIWFLLGFAVQGERADLADLADLDVGEGLVPSRAGASPAPTFSAPPPAPPPVSLGRQLLAQFGLLAPSVPREIGIGLVLGVGAWVVVLVALIGVGMALWALGGENAVPKEPPAMVPFIAGLPIGVKVLVSLSAGVVEEGFFRGFLQPRIGILLSTAFFALAHLSYGEPFMLIGITLLSLIYALLVRWRQTIWPAIAAHALFDGIQLLIVVPAVLRVLQGSGAKAAGFLSFFG